MERPARASRTTFPEAWELVIHSGQDAIGASLTVPDRAVGLVLFAHGSGSSRFSPRNRSVARFLNDAGLATLLLDLLTPSEAELDAHTAEFRFDIELLASRLVAATRFASEQDELRLPLAYFGASTGAAAALIAAAKSPVPV